MRVKLSYNAFEPAMSISIDGQPLARVSRLAKYQVQHFEKWCGEIFDLVATEVNGSYDLLYVGRSCEARILGQLSGANSKCMSFSSEAPMLSDTAFIRLKKLSSLIQSGLVCKRLSCVVHVYTDEVNESLNRLISEKFPKLSFCKFKAQIHPISDFVNHPVSEPAYILLFKGAKTESLLRSINQSSRTVILHVDENNCTLKVFGNCFEEFVSQQNLLTILEQYFELWTFVDLLSTTLKSISVSEGSPMFLQVTMLDKQEPTVHVILPASIEYGEFGEIKVQTIPYGASVDEDVQYRISDNSVLQLTSQGLKAVGVGEAVVEAYIAGKSMKIASKKITCYRRNRIQQLTLNTDSIELLAGEKFVFSYTYLPADADDVSKIRLSSSNGIIAAVDGEMSIRARDEGQCTIYAQSERASASCTVKVYPRITELKTSIDSIEAKVGEITSLTVSRIPSSATLQKLQYFVCPSSIGRYEIGAKGFYAANPGSGELIISTQDKSIAKHIPVVVKEHSTEESFSWKLIAIIVISLIIIWLLLRG